MDSLIANEDALGLNIVCVNDAKSSNGSNNVQKGRKPKKKNKYEKRRAKAQRAKLMKEGGSREHVNSSTRNDKDLKKSEAAGDNPNEKKSQQQTDSEKNEKNAVVENDTVPETYRSKNSMVSQNNENTISTETIKCFDSATSRKKQQLRTEQLLKDEARRAEYMSTYHARPYEMDRKSGAVSKIHESKESTHIFENDDDYDDDSDAENETSNPFLNCGLHPRIVHAITSEKGMNLQRPTVIQRNAWDQILMRKGRKDNKKIGSRNLFVQSETGSGKTLAYLLPIVQVCGQTLLHS